MKTKLQQLTKTGMKKLGFLLLLSAWAFTSPAQTVAEKLDTYFTASLKADVFNGSVLIMQNGQPHTLYRWYTLIIITNKKA